MTYSVLVLFWRKPSLTPEEFKNYIETKHVPLVSSLLGPDHGQLHARIYLSREERTTGSIIPSDPTRSDDSVTVLHGAADKLDFDALAHITYENEEAFKRSRARRLESEFGAIIAADEEKFLLREKVVVAAASEAFVSTYAAA